MPKKPLVEIDPESLRNFNDLLEEMQEVTGAELKKVIRNTSRDMAFSLIRVTPIAPQGIRARGFAKAGWLKSLRGLGVTPKAEFDKQGGEAAERLSDFVDGLDKSEPFTELINQVPFIEEIGGAVLELAIADTSTKLEKRLTKMSRKLAGTWAR
jgi:hypothetical protein